MEPDNTPRPKRGRPVKGQSAMNAAQRKQAQRARDRRESIEAIGAESKASLRALLSILARVEQGDAAHGSAQRAWDEIGRRYFVTVTEDIHRER